ncbi:hypothetical protein HF995_04335 [Sanguibacter hominis ATCC BAA-789]|uniref:Right handed beta helix domain-containing protein n=1 Tax=Sanguibacter hominis ATCC BAA-789 TaxID=1312740 RepID=A0A9X5IRA4_9MICO|nr:hypothetical protein [Sanguibacter hominis]NKX92508.1 hypothetical protein [Sanguibacter hominis ATCC BAA-789]
MHTPDSTTTSRAISTLIASVIAAVVGLSGLAVVAPAATAASSTPESISQRVAKKKASTYKAVTAKRTLGSAKGTTLKAGKATTKKVKRHAKVPAKTTSLVVKVTVRGAKKPGTLQLWTPGKAKVERTVVKYGKGTTIDKVRITTSASGKIRLKASTEVRVKLSTVGFKKRTAKPNATNTGVPTSKKKKLKVHNRDLVVTKNGTVIDGYDIRGVVKIRANDVTIKNSIVRGGARAKSITHLVQIADDARRTTIVDSEIAATHASPYVMGVVGARFTLLRTNIHRVIDQVTIIGPHVLIEDSWLHGNLSYANDPNHRGGPSHDDNIQIQQGTNIRVIGSRLEGSSSAAVMITQGRGKVANARFEGNWINNGSCSVNITRSAYGPLQGVAVTGNSFGTATRHQYCGIIMPVTTKLVEARNFFTDNHAFRISRGA